MSCLYIDPLPKLETNYCLTQWRTYLIWVGFKIKRNKMTYSKPEISTLMAAIKAIEASRKNVQTLLESHTGHYNDTPAAYEADE
jgi:hypothetical protein